MKKISLLILLTFSFAIYAEEMIPLSRYIEENPKFKEDLPSAAYFVSRCSALFSKVENRLKQDNRQKYKVMYESFKMWGVIYDGSGLIIMKKIGMSLEKYKGRYKTHLDAYEKQTVENWNLNGDMFVGWVGDDLNICTANYKHFEAYSSKNINELPK